MSNATSGRWTPSRLGNSTIIKPIPSKIEIVRQLYVTAAAIFIIIMRFKLCTKATERALVVAPRRTDVIILFQSRSLRERTTITHTRSAITTLSSIITLTARAGTGGARPGTSTLHGVAVGIHTGGAGPVLCRDTATTVVRRRARARGCIPHRSAGCAGRPA